MDDEGDLVCENCGHVIDPPPSEDDVIHVCQYCNEKNRNLVPDEDGDLVCQHCGHVVPEDAIYEGGVIATCGHCGRVNHGLEPDEDGDLVCEECGHVIDPPHSDDDVIHRCAHCDYENRNLERDEEGDLVCQECGYVIPEESDDRTEVRNFLLPAVEFLFLLCSHFLVIFQNEFHSALGLHTKSEKIHV